jgi:hypothetical protein
MATGTDSVRRVPRPRGSLTDAQQRRLTRAAGKRSQADADYRAEVLAVMAEGASFSEVSSWTGHSTKTLQTWKREAGVDDEKFCRACAAGVESSEHLTQACGEEDR